MSVELQLTGYHRSRGSIKGAVRVVSDGNLRFADTVNLESAKSRRCFTRDLLRHLGEEAPSDDEVQGQLLDLLKEAETELDADPRPDAPSEAEDEERIESYAKRAQGYDYIQTKDVGGDIVESRIPISNFTVEIVEDVIIDNGAEQCREFALEGQCNGRPLPSVRVTVAEFAAMNWILERYGAGIRVLPGQGRKDLLRDAIQVFSLNVEERRIYGHMGWRRTPEGLLYLHAGGAIGALGAVPGITVELSGHLARYCLPPPPTGPALRDAVHASWEFLDVALPSVTAPILGCMYGAPLAEVLKPSFVLWIQGITGVFKTTITTLALCHFGDFSWQGVPANWESSVNSLELQAFLIKDAPFLVDDFRPGGDRRDSDEMRRKAMRLVRSAGNRNGRGRMRADTSLRPEYFPRGVVLVTAEEQPPGESTSARRLKVELAEGAVDVARLTEMQMKADLLALAMSGYLQWLAQKLEADDEWLQGIYRQASELGSGLGGHRRHAQTYAYLLSSWCVFAEFARSVGAVSEEDVQERLTLVQVALREVATSQAEEAREVRPELIYLGTIADLLAGGKVHLATTDGAAPLDAEAWGWSGESRTDDTGEHDAGYRPRGDRIGWVDDASIYLIPAVTHRAVAQAVAGRNDTFAISDQALRTALQRGGFLLPGNKEGGKRHNVWAESSSRNAVRLDRRAVEALWDRREG